MTELVDRFRQAALVGPGQVMIQELEFQAMVGSSFPIARSLKMEKQLAAWSPSDGVSIHPEFGQGQFLCRDHRSPLLETLSTRFLRRSSTTGWLSSSTSLIHVMGSLNSSMSTHVPGATIRSGRRAGVDFPSMLFADQLGEAVHLSRRKKG